jgi:hypothetical protein
MQCLTSQTPFEHELLIELQMGTWNGQVYLSTKLSLYGLLWQNRSLFINKNNLLLMVLEVGKSKSKALADSTSKEVPHLWWSFYVCSQDIRDLEGPKGMKLTHLSRGLCSHDLVTCHRSSLLISNTLGITFSQPLMIPTVSNFSSNHSYYNLNYCPKM